MYGINIAQGPVVPWLVIGTNVSVFLLSFPIFIAIKILDGLFISMILHCLYMSLFRYIQMCHSGNYLVFSSASIHDHLITNGLHISLPVHKETPEILKWWWVLNNSFRFAVWLQKPSYLFFNCHLNLLCSRNNKLLTGYSDQ